MEINQPKKYKNQLVGRCQNGWNTKENIGRLLRSYKTWFVI